MARFEMELPNDMIKEFERMNIETKNMLGEMTKAGAEQVLKNIKANVPASFRGSDIMSCLHLSKVYTTPSDDGINTKVAFWGYFTPKKSPGPKWIKTRGTDKMAAELVVNVFEYGRSDGTLKKHPFVRKSFNKKQIIAAMSKKRNEWLKAHGYGDEWLD